jgi:hypothetical protein
MFISAGLITFLSRPFNFFTFSSTNWGIITTVSPAEECGRHRGVRGFAEQYADCFQDLIWDKYIEIFGL